ncbi:hypothetical protein BOTBODRAFT_182338 [Botryobasidium botryosum FD-172 SS1]|uniref:Uncharacterized protein n=1 Tax=Botryobasidium botryosum (strain FD-172 SS1) TaxID=930990 RepID=A0A067LRN7_BOTB1|nr:hypothetical protein BOTBODRAFT_182338 [Botryobasidium botryosum FD-172 SS1]
MSSTCGVPGTGTINSGMHPVTVHLIAQASGYSGPILEIPMVDVQRIAGPHVFQWLRFAAYTVVGFEGEIRKGTPGALEPMGSVPTVTFPMGVTYIIPDDCVPVWVDVLACKRFGPSPPANRLGVVHHPVVAPEHRP